MQIFVRTIDAKLVVLNITPETTVGNIKAMVARKEEIPANEQRLSFGGRSMEDEKTAADYNLQKDSTLEVFVDICENKKRTSVSIARPVYKRPSCDNCGSKRMSFSLVKAH